MILIKASLTGVVVVSLCMANISGTVTDTGTTPIPGAVVQLEKGGRTATTGPDGRFTIVTTPTAITSGNSIMLPNGLSARVVGTMLEVTTLAKSAVEVMTFDLNGKSLSAVCKILDAGNYSIALPRRGAGVYLYKVKFGNRVFVIKGNAVGGISHGRPPAAQGASIQSLAKQAETMTEINDVIAATKDGYLNYRCGIGNSDTSGVAIKMITNAGNVTDVEGNVYQSVRIGNQVWTVENLRVAKYSDGTAIQLDTSMATWANTATPKYCFYKNAANADSIKRYGALYNWYVASPTNSKKIAPAGWHVPSAAEWDTLQDYLIAKGYNWDKTITDNKIAKALAAKTDWNTSSTAGMIGCDMTKNNSSGFSALPGGYRGPGGGFHDQSSGGDWWSATERDATTTWCCGLFNSGANLSRAFNGKSCGISVRLLRD